MEHQTKIREVNSWLQNLFDDEPVPEFEVNSRTVEMLYQLSETVSHYDKKVDLVVKDLRQKNTEYDADARRLTSLLSRIKLDHNSFSESGLNSIRMLAQLGTLLHIKDASKTCYILALQELDDKLNSAIEQKEMENQELEKLTCKFDKTLRQFNNSKMALDSAKKSALQAERVNEEMGKEIPFIKSKMKDYHKKEIPKLNDQLAKTKVNPSVFHEKLVAKYEILKELQEKLASMSQELQSCSSLPPALSEAKIKIEQLKKELVEMEEKFTDSIKVNFM